jgi:hypothetical protein
MREAGGREFWGEIKDFRAGTREDFGFSFTCPAGGGADLAPKGCRGMCGVGEKNWKSWKRKADLAPLCMLLECEKDFSFQQLL